MWNSVHTCHASFFLFQVFQVVLSFAAFPKPMSWKYALGGLLVVMSLYLLQVSRRGG